MMFGLSTKTGREIILRKDFETIEEAYIYFAKTKQMPLENFKKIFIVAKL